MGIDFFSSFSNAFYLCLKLTIIIIVLMIVYEFYENSKLYEFTKKIMKKPFSAIGVAPASSITMVAGLVLGIVYGAGILIKNASNKEMSPKELVITSLFLSVCHAVIEDTLLFVAVGANGFVILATRIIFALLLILFINMFYKHKNG